MLAGCAYSKTFVKRPLSKRPKISFQDQLSHNAGQKYCRMLQGEHSAILKTCIKLPFVIKIHVLSILSGCFTQVLLYWQDGNSYFMFTMPNNFKKYRPRRLKTYKQGRTNFDTSTLIRCCLTLGVSWEGSGKSEKMCSQSDTW